jgi:long-chain acyl-CoA synthetase
VSGFLERLAPYGERTALVWRDAEHSYAWLRRRVAAWQVELEAAGIAPGAIVALEADFTPSAVALLLALAERGAVVVPLTASVERQKPHFRAIAQCEWRLAIDDADGAQRETLGIAASHPLYAELRRRGHPGLVLFSSGSTGGPKGALHDLSALLEKFRTPRPPMRAVGFLLFDHIGGLNTLLHVLSNGGCLVGLDTRDPDAVLAAVARHRVELLPTSPTFLNLVLFSEAWKRHDLSTLRVVTYGTEPMPEATLKRLHEVLPRVKLQQTYGLSELGILRSTSRASDSLWVRIGGEGFETRVVDGLLEIRARSAMLGYLNAPSPFTDDGWLRTGDAVEVDGDWLRILGRRSEIINVGGEKVYPAEVEGVLQEMPEVAEATVFGERNAITGMIVCARIRPRDPGADAHALKTRIAQFARQRLAPFKVPVRVLVEAQPLHGPRFKKTRSPSG